MPIQRTRAAGVDPRAPATVRHLVRSLGLGVLAAGFSLILQPTVAGLVFGLLLDTAVGAFLAVPVPALEPITPALVSFVVALTVFGLDDLYQGENPIRFLVPPLLIFLPGAKITTGTMELASGAIVSGASRLMSGLVDLLLLAVAIVAAAAVVGAPNRDLLDRPVPEFGLWTAGPALILIALGYQFYSCAPRRSVPWIFLVLSVAFTTEHLASYAFDPGIAAFLGAAAMTPVVIAVDRRPSSSRASSDGALPARLLPARPRSIRADRHREREPRVLHRQPDDHDGGRRRDRAGRHVRHRGDRRPPLVGGHAAEATPSSSPPT